MNAEKLLYSGTLLGKHIIPTSNEDTKNPRGKETPHFDIGSMARCNEIIPQPEHYVGADFDLFDMLCQINAAYLHVQLNRIASESHGSSYTK